jgi:hypothetical protein
MPDELSVRSAGAAERLRFLADSQLANYPELAEEYRRIADGIENLDRERLAAEKLLAARRQHE